MIRVSFTVLLLLVPFWIAAESFGRLASLVGEVTIVRNGDALDADKVIDGVSVEGFDTIITGQSGATDVVLSPTSGFSGILHLAPKTVLVATSSPLPSKLQIDLLSGSLTAKLQKLQDGICSIDTGFGVVSGGSGTLMTVLNPWGSAIIASESGNFLVTGTTEAVMTEPGTVVELSETRTFPHAMPINLATLSSYLDSWMDQKRQEAEASSEKLFWGEAKRYQLQLGVFQRAWERWQREKDDGVGSLKSVAVGLRRAERPLARSFYRIAAQQLWLDQGKLLPDQELTRNYTTTQFFQQWNSDFELWVPRIEKARGLYRTVAQSNSGQFPSDGPDLNITWESSYFY